MAFDQLKIWLSVRSAYFLNHTRNDFVLASIFLFRWYTALYGQLAAAKSYPEEVSALCGALAAA